MKHYIICMFIFIQCIFTTSLGSSVDLKLFSSSPVGPYRIVFKQVYNCNPTQNTKMQFNMSLSHKDNSTMLVSNTSSTIQFDDNLFVEIKMALKDSFGIWKENVYVHKLPNACSTVKQLLGKAWPEMIHGFGYPSVNCPIPLGVYTSPGMNLQSICENGNFPKMFIYGSYKFHILYTRKNEIVGCQGFIFDMKRP
ncbi:uncharacterized protein LOC132944321 [Metopolophium dirhodum]|uniref:uncharacterized protein LOC132944321 n=1 Tax=Metopolophium dirhodum TaxID=44670 RepID=UPI002990261E|nr:uncharacterized protein LOC132944321 [Metopolophium dirhodum]